MSLGKRAKFTFRAVKLQISPLKSTCYNFLYPSRVYPGLNPETPLGNIFTVLLSACKFPSAFCERQKHTPNTGKIKKFHMLCNIGKGAGGQLHPQCARRAPLVFSPTREHTHTRKLSSAYSLLQSSSCTDHSPLQCRAPPSLDSLSSPAAAVPPAPFHQVLLPPADPNWNLGLRLHITNPVNTRATNHEPLLPACKLLWQGRDLYSSPFALLSPKRPKLLRSSPQISGGASQYLLFRLAIGW